jgi:flavin reductase (DIM6/NTAB) family NADH-FMN oxidoreductase RutF
MVVEPEDLRIAMRKWTSGVTIVTSRHAGSVHGMTVSSFTSVALSPPTILISLQQGSRTHRMVVDSGVFGITILSKDQIELSERFAGKSTEDQDRLAGINTHTLVSGAPLLNEGLAYLDCQVVKAIEVGSNTLFLGEVLAAKTGGDGSPLIYHNQDYRQLQYGGVQE